MNPPTIIDNFLPEEVFDELQKELVWNKLVKWALLYEVTHEQENNLEDFCLVNMVFNQGKCFNAPLWMFFEKHIFKLLDAKAFLRIKVNFYPHTHELTTHSIHQDYAFDHKGMILSLNTCNGGTVMQETGEKFGSEANRAFFFNPKDYHASTTTTNQKGRFNIIFNYL